MTEISCVYYSGFIAMVFSTVVLFFLTAYCPHCSDGLSPLFSSQTRFYARKKNAPRLNVISRTRMTMNVVCAAQVSHKMSLTRNGSRNRFPNKANSTNINAIGLLC